MASSSSSSCCSSCVSYSMASSSPHPAKLFIGGLAWRTTENDFKEYFGKFGKVIDAAVIRNKFTGTGRGFGFVEFSESASASKVLEEGSHIICGKKVEVKKAIQKADPDQNNKPIESQHSNQAQDQNGGPNSYNDEYQGVKKIFVGGLSRTITTDEFKIFFENFGPIEDAIVVHHPVTNHPRGFGFVTFERQEDASKVLHDRFHQMKDKQVEVKVARPRDLIQKKGTSGESSNLMMAYGDGFSMSNYGYYLFVDPYSYYETYTCANLW